MVLLELLLRAMGPARRALGLNSFHTTQLFHSSHTTELTQLISLSVPHSTSLNSSDLSHLIKVQCFCVQEEHERFGPPAPAQDYVQGAVLQMTGDQGAVLLCAEEHERYCPPHPQPNP